MGKAAAKACRHPGCGLAVHDGTSRCDKHKVRAGTFADKRRGSRHERGYGTEWDKTRERIMQRDNGLCQECGRCGFVTLAYAVDHIVCRAEGGPEDDTNLEAICKPHHVAKTAQEARRALARGAQGGATPPPPTRGGGRK